MQNGVGGKVKRGTGCQKRSGGYLSTVDKGNDTAGDQGLKQQPGRWKDERELEELEGRNTF